MFSPLRSRSVGIIGRNKHRSIGNCALNNRAVAIRRARSILFSPQGVSNYFFWGICSSCCSRDISRERADASRENVLKWGGGSRGTPFVTLSNSRKVSPDTYIARICHRHRGDQTSLWGIRGITLILRVSL
jgi:hypothetical protein